MNAFRKLVSGRLAAQAKGAHLNADTLVAFAENALPRGERESVLSHLGQCADCRQVLFLSRPQLSELQQVLTVAPAKRPSFALRWGSVAVAVMVVTAVFIGRHELRKQTATTAQYKAPVSTASAAPATVAREKLPAELDEMRSAVEQKAAAPKLKVDHPEPKRMTAKPQTTFDFDRSGEVHVAAASKSAAAGNSPAKQLHGYGENEENRVVGGIPAPAPASVPAVQSPTSASVSAGRLRDDQKDFRYAAPGVLTKELAATSEFRGVVVDPSGAVISNAKVTATGPALTKTAVSDSEGKFYMSQLPAGNYSLKAEASGFRTTELQALALVPNQQSTLRVTLRVGASAETVEVAAGSVATDSTEAANKLDSTTVAKAQAIGGPVESTVSSRKKTANQVAMQKAAMPVTSLPQWTLSSLGAVQRSSDLGHTWQIVPVGSGAVFHALAAVGTHVWAGGKAGLLYHSADSGHSWVQVTATDAGRKLQADIVRIDFSDVENGTIRTANGQQWTTSDSGQIWHVK